MINDFVNYYFHSESQTNIKDSTAESNRQLTCDDKLIMSFKNQGTQVLDSTDKTTKKATNTTNLAERLISMMFGKLEVIMLMRLLELSAELKNNTKREKKNPHIPSG